MMKCIQVGYQLKGGETGVCWVVNRLDHCWGGYGLNGDRQPLEYGFSGSAGDDGLRVGGG